MPPMKRLAGKTLEYDVARERVYLKPGGTAGGSWNPYLTPAYGGYNFDTLAPIVYNRYGIPFTASFAYKGGFSNILTPSGFTHIVCTLALYLAAGSGNIKVYHQIIGLGTTAGTDETDGYYTYTSDGSAGIHYITGDQLEIDVDSTGEIVNFYMDNDGGTFNAAVTLVGWKIDFS